MLPAAARPEHRHRKWSDVFAPGTSQGFTGYDPRSLVLALVQDWPPGSLHDHNPKPYPDHREEDHVERPAYHGEHVLAQGQGHEKDQEPAPEWDPVELAGWLFRKERRRSLLV